MANFSKLMHSMSLQPKQALADIKWRTSLLSRSTECGGISLGNGTAVVRRDDAVDRKFE